MEDVQLVNVTSDNGVTPLHQAAAAPVPSSGLGATPLHHAVSAEGLQLNENINPPSGSGTTPLHHTVQREEIQFDMDGKFPITRQPSRFDP